MEINNSEDGDEVMLNPVVAVDVVDCMGGDDPLVGYAVDLTDDYNNEDDYEVRLNPLLAVDVVDSVVDDAEPLVGDTLEMADNYTNEVLIDDEDPVNVNIVCKTPEKTLTVMEGGVVKEVPTVGMAFESWQEVEIYYKNYAKSQGFGVCKPSSSKKDGVVKCVLWRCECWGKPPTYKKLGKVQSVEGVAVLGRPVKSKKCNCPAQLFASQTEPGGYWYIKRVILEHSNHNPTPSKAKFIKSNRVVPDDIKRTLKSYRKAGLSVSQIHAAIASSRNGYDNMPVTVEDLREEVKKERKFRLKDGDANAMMKYFDRMKKDNSAFFFAIRHDEENVLQEVLWVDARSRAAYREFCDVIVFDTTYLTNKYAMPFANIVGVNHHGQTILLGCALITRETTESFEWIFKTWLSCMEGRAPGGILTDQAPAIRRALEVVMPNTRHRWCLWHILKKLPLKLGRHPRFSSMNSAVKNVIYDSFSDDEFENRWASVMKEYVLESDDWLQGLYIERHMWVPAYTKHLFWAGMRTTQRVESIHSFFDDYVNNSTRLYEFVEQYCHAMEKRASSEKAWDESCSRGVIGLSTKFVYEKVYQKLYTNKMFREFQRQCQHVLYCTYGRTTDIFDTEVEILLRDRVWLHTEGCRETYCTKDKRDVKIKFNKETHDVSCECKLFECSGILCRHCICVMDMFDVQEVPEKYILRRWRKDINRKHTQVKVAYHDPTKTAEVLRFDKMQETFEGVGNAAMVSVKASEFVITSLVEMKRVVSEMNGVMHDSNLNDAANTYGVGSCSASAMESGVECTPGDSVNANPNISLTPTSNLVDPPLCTSKVTKRRKAIEELVGRKKGRKRTPGAVDNNSMGNARVIRKRKPRNGRNNILPPSPLARSEKANNQTASGSALVTPNRGAIVGNEGGASPYELAMGDFRTFMGSWSYATDKSDGMP